VLVADHHPVVLDGVSVAFQATSWLTVAGHARSGHDAITATGSLRPDVVLLDPCLPDMPGADVVPQLLARHPAVRVVLFTDYPEHEALGAALAAGAHGAVMKDTERAGLIDVITRVAAGERVTAAAAADGALLTRKLARCGLTRREYEVLRLAAMGQTNPEIASSMGLTRNTVKTYLQRTREKLGARNRMEASLRARQAGLLLAPAAVTW
jgi:DNA-binding NarL/FixJ family response regulator